VERLANWIFATCVVPSHGSIFRGSVCRGQVTTAAHVRQVGSEGSEVIKRLTSLERHFKSSLWIKSFLEWS